MAVVRPLVLATLLTGTPAVAEDSSPLIWMDNSITALTGTGFEVPGNNISTLTFEHVSAWNWGDVFGFFDYLDYHDNAFTGSSWYGEISPRLSLGKVAGLKFSEDGLIRDVLIATTWERGKDGVEGLLIGGAVDLNLPGFTFFNVHAYARKDTGLGAGFDDMQWTIAWSRPFKVGEQAFVIDGFMDYVVGWGPQETALHLVPQIKWDLGATWGEPGKIWLGTEIDIWKNQFGIKDTAAFDTDQVAINAILKIHF
ncbi:MULTISPECIES: outer membrane protein OmpK [Kordiimonas]|jgi:nucleoside-specific outer membrane channel protein Tsx|uniref:outer membrane protein OmpK n=1 Tax=Kordiimonas TaxID=288021 RepID=UPI00257FE391|nr:outer membrane protein OmpK [Kordiimonas sp. UBA4487]